MWDIQHILAQHTLTIIDSNVLFGLGSGFEMICRESVKKVRLFGLR